MLDIQYPFKNSTIITMRLLRAEDDCSEENDDMIAIAHQGDDLYHVYFKDGTWTEQTSHMTALSGEELDAYLENLLFLLSRDARPFRSIQLNVPCMPVIMLSVDDLKKRSVRDSIHTLLPVMKSCIKVRW